MTSPEFHNEFAEILFCVLQKLVRTVNVQLRDRNDNTPTFARPGYAIQVDEVCRDDISGAHSEEST